MNVVTNKSGDSFPAPSMKARSKRRMFFSLFTIGLVLVAAFAAFQVTTVAKNAHASDTTAVTTYKNGNARTGANANETLLNTTNVNTKQFGKRMSYPVDGQIYAQPLYMPGVTINGSAHKVVFVATENDNVYAFDAAASGSKTAPLWQASLGTPIVAKEVYLKYGCCDIQPSIGITGTPVIDPAAGILYVVTANEENGQYINRLHALDITTGKDKVPAQTISASVPGSGQYSANGQVSFNAKTANQRPGLLLLNGNVYIGYAGYGDTDNDFGYYGWLLGYHLSDTGLQQVAVYNSSTTGGAGGGIWMSGGAPVTDSQGNIYLSVGNGTFDLDKGGNNAGDSLLKLSTQNGLKLTDYFTPYNQEALNRDDIDFGSSGVLLTPDQKLIAAGKEGRLYVADSANLGKYNSAKDNVIQETSATGGDPSNLSGGLFSSPAYWNNTVYAGGTTGVLKAFSFTNGKLSNAPTSQSPETFSFPGVNVSVSSDGTKAGTGLVWAIAPSVGNCEGKTDHCNPTGSPTLRAYDATDLQKELYSSSDDTTDRDQLPSYVKFTTPTVADGLVFVGTQGTLEIFGSLGSGVISPSAPASIVLDDSVQGKAANHFNYYGTWGHCGVSNGECGDPADLLYNDSNSWSNTKGDTATVAFKGTQIKLYAVKRGNHGIGTVSVDGGTETSFDLYDPKDQGNQLIWSSPVLSRGKHTLRVTVTGTKNESATDSFVALDRVDIIG